MRRLLLYSIPLWKLLILASVVGLLQLASAPGCSTNIATIMNYSTEVANVTLQIRDIVVWRGKIDPGKIMTTPYYIAVTGKVVLKAEFAHGSVEGGGDYVTPYLVTPEIFFIEKERVSMMWPERTRSDVGHSLATMRVASSCAIQSVLDLTGAPDPADLK